MKIKKFTFITLFFLLGIGLQFAFAQGTHKAVPLGSVSAPYGYYEYLPAGFNKNSGKYPLLIFLHGVAEQGNGKDQLKRAIRFGPGREIEKGKDLPFVVISPQTPKWWDSKKLNELINHAVKNYNIDENRIYMTGLSLGAMGTFAYAASYPDRIAAMVGIAGNADNSKACRYSHVPLWAFHGDRDGVVHVNGSKTLVAAYNKCNPVPNPKAKLTIMAGVGHTGWNEVYDRSRGDIYQWMLGYSRNGKTNTQAPANKMPVVSAGSDQSVTLPKSELYVSGSASDKDGSIKSLSWQKISGPDAEMSGTNGSKLKLKKLNKGNYVFRLTAKDNAGATAYDEMKLEVKAAAVAKKEEKPKDKNSSAGVTASAGSDKTITLPVKKEHLSGSAKFVNSFATSYKWEKVSGPSVKMGGSGANLILTDLNEGEYVFRFTVGNSKGLFHSDDMKLKVVKGKQPATDKSSPEPEPAQDPNPNDAPNDAVQGLYYSYYKIDPSKPWNKLPDLRKMKAVKTGRINNFDLSPRDQNDYFAFAFDGYIKIDRGGDYFFYTMSDEGSKLYINDRLVTDNDGQHTSRVKYNRVKLGPGSHKIRVEYFENKGGEQLYVSYKGPGVELQKVPKSRLSTGGGENNKEVAKKEDAKTSYTKGLNYAYFESADAHNRWSKLPDFNKINPKKKGTVADFSLSPAQRTNHFGLVLEGHVKIAKAGDYTFYTDSDDGSQLFIDGKKVVDNDGLHAPRERSGKIKLSSGYHAIRVVYYEYEGWEKLEVKWQGPGIGKQIIPASVLYRKSSSGKKQNTLAQRNGLSDDFVGEAELAGIKLYPNPAQDYLQLQLGNTGEETVTIAIMDLSGRSLYKGDHQVNGGAAVSINLQDLNIDKGAYVLTVKGLPESGQKAFRFIKE